MITISNSNNNSISLFYQSQHDEFYCYLICLERSPFYAKQEYTFDKASIDSFLQSSQYLEIDNIRPISFVSIDLDFSLEFKIESEDSINVMVSFYDGEKGYLQSYFSINKQSFSLLVGQLRELLYGEISNMIPEGSYKCFHEELEDNSTSSDKELVLYDSNRNKVLTLQREDKLGGESFYIIIDNPPFGLRKVLIFNMLSLRQFVEDIDSLYNNENSLVILKSSDGYFTLSLTSNSYLHIYASATYESQNDGRLTTSFEFDQSFLPMMICQLTELINRI